MGEEGYWHPFGFHVPIAPRDETIGEVYDHSNQWPAATDDWDLDWIKFVPLVERTSTGGVTFDATPDAVDKIVEKLDPNKIILALVVAVAVFGLGAWKLRGL